jgi:hypothetical protein
MEQEIGTLWHKYMPEYVSLYDVDRGDDLSDHVQLLQACIEKNSLQPLSEEVFDWWDCPEEVYLDEIEAKMIADGLTAEFEQYFDEIKEWLWDHDKSTPIEDLLRNTGKMTLFYSLGVETDGWHEAFMCHPWRGETEAMSAYKVRRALGIKKGTKESDVIDEIVSNASYGGELRIYFEGNLTDYISGEPYCEAGEKEDFRRIRFKGKVAVAIHDAVNGSGWFEFMELDKEFPFNRENLFFSKIEKYSLEEVYGFSWDWADKCCTPELSVEAPTTKYAAIKTSQTGENLSVDARYEKVFQTGGCTAGDMNIRRHRDVYYDNHIPCGSHCPHCGTFWID